eukprot:TRINITY_DN678_c2_g1_i2.p1 TRINITY_DN678_c2_g1~~TRINITY_DN678_c2_g1_i2.p1  ORF type:complete len:111 (+),score=47.40 TRINITY_DN678_c2_g1_i2:371-703(+)
MGRLFIEYLEGDIFVCKSCSTHLAKRAELTSKAFQGSTGKAYLFNKCVNVSVGVLEDRFLTTGLHTVGDIYCNSCSTVIGWKYEAAFEESQKYKVGKFILEKSLISSIYV